MKMERKTEVKMKNKISIKGLFLTVMVALLGFVTTVSAAPITITVDDTKSLSTDVNSHYVTNQGTITISNVNTADVLSAYKVLDAYYNQTSNVVSYDFTTDFKAFLAQSTTYNSLSVQDYMTLTSGNVESGSTRTESTLDTLASAYAGYIKKNSVAGTPMTSSGTTSTVTTDAGSYLILPTSTSKVYAVMVGNIGISVVDGNWALENATIVAKVSEAGLTKKSDGKSSVSAEIGEDIPFEINLTVPQYPTNATNRKYKLTDTMSAGLTFSGMDSISIRDGETVLALQVGADKDGDPNYWDNKREIHNPTTSAFIGMIIVEGQKITIDFDTRSVNSTTLKVTYNAKLNNNAVIGGNNNNSAQLEYSNDPYGTGTSTTPITLDGPGVVIVKTYSLSILKHEKNNEANGLSGATFEVYRDQNLTDLQGTVTTGADGTVVVKGLKEGSYWLKETKSPAGYSLINDPVQITIADADATDGVITAKISNAKVGVLPITGGMGTIIFTVSGAVLMIGALWFIFVYRKKNNRVEV